MSLDKSEDWGCMQKGTDRALALVGFRPEHWGYDYPPEYAEFNVRLGLIVTHGLKPNSILLGGVVGTGKTAMLATLCKSLYEANGVPSVDLFASRVKYCTHSELADLWSNEFNDRSDLPSEDYFKKAPVLFLDDLFSAPTSLSGRSTAKLEELIDWRWSNHLKTFLATNISLKDLWKPANKQYYRIARRLSEKKWMYYQTLTHKFGEIK